MYRDGEHSLEGWIEKGIHGWTAEYGDGTERGKSDKGKEEGREGDQRGVLKTKMQVNI